MSDESQPVTTEDRPRRRPPNAGKGRRPGSKNKFNADVQRTILTALDRAGGVHYLTRMAEENPGPFMNLVGKCVPREMRAEITAELTIRQEVRRNLVDSLVELIGSKATQVIDVTPERIRHEASESVEPDEPREHVPGSEANAEIEAKEAELAEQEAKDGKRTRVSDADVTRASEVANEGLTYLSQRAQARARES